MGKTKLSLIRSGKDSWKFRFFVSFLLFPGTVASLFSEKSKTPYANSDLNPAFFFKDTKLSFSLGILAQVEKKLPPSYGAWAEFPLFKRNDRHLWTASALYQERRIFEDEGKLVRNGYAGIRYSYLFRENFHSSVSVGWERGPKDLLVLSIAFAIPDKQGLQFLGKTGSELRSVSVFFHSPFANELQLFLGVSRIWGNARVEDTYLFGIGISWDSISSSFFGSRLADGEPSFGGKIGIRDTMESRDFSPEKETQKLQLPRSPLDRYPNHKLGIQELLSIGFPLEFALKISGESSRTKEEFVFFFKSLSEKDRTKIWVLLKKKNRIDGRSKS
ncbi:hypothetical protein AB3N59_13940 [Leptospira sp. WS92.C1]